MSTEVQHSPEGAVLVSYNALVSKPHSLQSAISAAFGSHSSCLGIIIVTDLPPEFAGLRDRLLRLAGRFAALPESVREKYADPESRWSIGWSHGKEMMNGKPGDAPSSSLKQEDYTEDLFTKDVLKGSYYANPILDNSSVSEEQKTNFPEYYGQNVWPEATERGVEGFEVAFKSLGRFIFNVGCELATACQPFAASHLVDQSLTLLALISPNTTKARLLHYFPPNPQDSSLHSDDGPVDSWCGFHLDHSLLTGLCSAMYLTHETSLEPVACAAPSATSGLYIRTRGGKLTKVSIPPDCLAFQTGEALELATNGRLRATPHCVRVGGSGAENVSRETFALFMQPDVEAKIGPHETFGTFSKRIFSEHYGLESI